MTTATERADEVRMMQSPDKWPLWPVLPLKKRGGSEVGFIVEGRGPRVTIGSIYALKQGFLGPQLQNMPEVPYGSFEALVMDGWVVD